MLMDEQALLRLIDDRAVDAIVVVHLYGQLQNLDTIGPAAEQAGIPIVEDAAQVLGATRHGKAAGQYGAMICLSFDPTKVIGAFGSGGAVLCRDDQRADHVRRLRYHGHDGKGLYLIAGYNSQMHSVQAALLGVKLENWQEWQNQRTRIARRYSDGLADVSGIEPLEVLPENVHNFHKFVFHARDRDGLKAHLDKLGIQTKIHYPIPLHQQPEFQPFVGGVQLPNVEAAAGTILSLPIYPEMTSDEVDRVVASVRAYNGR
jgi:dTDP-4-amino-4,6-dideoxygalactose transaminase